MAMAMASIVSITAAALFRPSLDWASPGTSAEYRKARRGLSGGLSESLEGAVVGRSREESGRCAATGTATSTEHAATKSDTRRRCECIFVRRAGHAADDWRECMGIEPTRPDAVRSHWF